MQAERFNNKCMKLSQEIPSTLKLHQNPCNMLEVESYSQKQGLGKGFKANSKMQGQFQATVWNKTAKM